jgi:hypothetical protein
MQHEDEPLSRVATDQADDTGREGEDGGEGNAPVSEAWGHKNPSLLHYGEALFDSKHIKSIRYSVTVSI